MNRIAISDIWHSRVIKLFGVDLDQVYIGSNHMMFCCSTDSWAEAGGVDAGTHDI